MRLLVQSGAVSDGGTPQAVARFLREHAGELDKTQVGGVEGGGAPLSRMLRNWARSPTRLGTRCTGVDLSRRVA